MSHGTSHQTWLGDAGETPYDMHRTRSSSVGNSSNLEMCKTPSGRFGTDLMVKWKFSPFENIVYNVYNYKFTIVLLFDGNHVKWNFSEYLYL